MKLNNIQVLRGISALLVCCFHLKERLNFPKLKTGDFLFGNGSIGVPIFFVISGFIMVFTTKNLKHKDTFQEMKDFMIKRIIRIVPLYFLLTFAWIILGGNYFYYFQGDAFQRLWHSLLFLPQKDVFPVLYLGWSLNYEMFFYVVFALSFLLGKKRYFAVILFFVIAISAGLLFKIDHAWIQMVTSFLNVYFLIGILLGLFYEKINLSENYLWLLSIIGIVLFLVLYFDIIHFNQYLPPLLIGLFVLSFLIFDRYLYVSPPRFLIMIGDISFSLYLIHPFVEIIFRRFKNMDPLLSVIVFLLEIIIVIIFSKISYEIIENRLTQILKKLILQRKNIV